MNEIFEDWNNDERMRNLFAEFRPRNVNPEGWMNKMNTWTCAVRAWGKKKRKVVFSLKDLKDACERKGEYPYCLEQVLMHMSREGTLRQKEDALNACAKQGWIGWGMDRLVKKPVSWGWKMVSSYVYGAPDNDNSYSNFVFPTLLEEISLSVFEKLESEVEFDTPTLSMSKCKNLCRDLCDEASFSLVFSHLQNQQKITVFTESGTQYIKVHMKAQETSTVNETDVGYVRLQKTVQKVEGEIEKLRTDIQGLTDQAKAAMKLGQKTKVQLFIRRRKQLEKMVEQKLKTIEHLEGMIHKLQATSSNQEVIGALRAGLDAQKKMASKGFNIDAIEDTMADIQDAFGEQSEIEQAMASPCYLQDGDDSALEQELDELLEQDKLKNKNKTILWSDSPSQDKQSFVLPNVPTKTPSPQRVPVRLMPMEGL